MFIDEPYFMKDIRWYYFDFKEKKYKLTDQAPKKAKESYVEYYNELYNEKR